MPLDIQLYRNNEDKPGKLLVLLIHGLAAPETWVRQGRDWASLLLSDNELNEVDVGVVKYDTAHLVSGLFQIEGNFRILVDRFINKLRQFGRYFTADSIPYFQRKGMGLALTSFK
jgi:hypothetical protein